MLNINAIINQNSYTTSNTQQFDINGYLNNYNFNPTSQPTQATEDSLWNVLDNLNNASGGSNNSINGLWDSICGLFGFGDQGGVVIGNEQELNKSAINVNQTAMGDNNKLEAIWTIIPVIVLAGLIIQGLFTWTNIMNMSIVQCIISMVEIIRL